MKNIGYNKYIYSDTDSIHTTLTIEELTKFCDIDPVRLGAWKHEGTAKRGKFVRQKCYVEDFGNDKIEVTCAGMPKKCLYKKKDDKNLYYKDEEGKERIFVIKKFKTGFKCSGKLTFSHVKRWCYIN